MVASATEAIEYDSDVASHTVVGPLIMPGVAGVLVIVIARHSGSDRPQEFSVRTHISPSSEPKLTTTDGVPEPEAIVAPGGSVQM